MLGQLVHWRRCGIRGPAWGAGLLLLLPVLGSGAEEDGPIPRLIVGGERATVQSYPFVVFIVRPVRGSCTGSIIAPSWVLTAAHCLTDGAGLGARLHAHDSVRVFHGRGDLTQLLERTSKRLILHPKRSTETTADLYHYDIGLIELSKPFPVSFSAGIDLARRSAEDEYAPSGTSSVMVGFGRTGNWLTDYKMHSVSENLYHAKDCRNRLNIFQEAITVHDETICSGTSTRRNDSGDSGGPLIVSYSVDGNTRWLQVGVASRSAVSDTWNLRDNYKTAIITSVYMRVSSYADWLHSTTQGAASLVSGSDPDDDDIDEITGRLSEVNAQINSLRATVQSLQTNNTLLKQNIDEFKDAERQDKVLQATEDETLNSLSALLAE